MKRFGLMAVALLAACTGLPTGEQRPALEVLSLDFERTNFQPGATVSGRIAQAQRGVHVSTPVFGALRRAGKGPIPTEVRVAVTRLQTRGGRMVMEGTLELRDLALGNIMARLQNFRAEGAFPVPGRGASADGLVFRGADDEIIAWLETLSCDTAQRSCGIAPVAAPSEAVAEVEDSAEEAADINLDTLVGNRTSSIRRINTGGIRPEAIVAAAPAAAPAPESAASSAGSASLGTTVAALGLLGRSGFWLETPLVSSETPGSVTTPDGRKLSLTLIPKSGPAGGGSQISLAALTELGFSMTDLVTLEVFR